MKLWCLQNSAVCVLSFQVVVSAVEICIVVVVGTCFVDVASFFRATNFTKWHF